MTDYKKIREKMHERFSKTFEKLHKSELTDKQHEFQSDWYRPARCTECGQRREHNTHKSADEKDTK